MPCRVRIAGRRRDCGAAGTCEAYEMVGALTYAFRETSISGNDGSQKNHVVENLLFRVGPERVGTYLKV